MSDGVVRLSFPARAEYLILARLALAGLARTIRIEDETLADLKLAVTEACGNVVRHAYGGSQIDGVVTVTIEASDSSISILVEDDGVGMPVGTEDAGMDVWFRGGEVEGGMGLAIISAIADEVDIRRASTAGGTALGLRKQLP